MRAEGTAPGAAPGAARGVGEKGPEEQAPPFPDGLGGPPGGAFRERLRGLAADTTLAMALVAGRGSGLLRALCQAGRGGVPFTPAELAALAEGGAGERACRAWLACLAAGRIVGVGPGGAFTLSPEHAEALDPNGAGCSAELEAMELTMLLAASCAGAVGGGRRGGEPEVVDAGARQRGLQRQWVSREILPLLLDRVLPLQPGLLGLLARGGRCLDVACGGGEVILLLAQRFPRSSFRGADSDPRAVSEAQAEAARQGLRNVTFTCADAPRLLEEEPGSADLVLAFWSERAIAAASAWPPTTLRAARDALVPSGVLIARGLRLLEDERSNPLHDQATSFYSLAFLQETSRTGEGSSRSEDSDSGGGAGMRFVPSQPEKGEPPFWGDESAAEAFKRAGFHELEMHLINTGDDASSASTFFTARTLPAPPAENGAHTSANRAADATVPASVLALPGQAPLGPPLVQVPPPGGSALENFSAGGFRLWGHGKRRGVQKGAAPLEAPAPPPSTEGESRV